MFHIFQSWKKRSCALGWKIISKSNHNKQTLFSFPFWLFLFFLFWDDIWSTLLLWCIEWMAVAIYHFLKSSFLLYHSSQILLAPPQCVLSQFDHLEAVCLEQYLTLSLRISPMTWESKSNAKLDFFGSLLNKWLENVML